MKKKKSDAKFKFVKIDERTTIMVSAHLSDEEAREKFLLKTEKGKRDHELSPQEKRLRRIAEAARKVSEVIFLVLLLTSCTPSGSWLTGYRDSRLSDRIDLTVSELNALRENVTVMKSEQEKIRGEVKDLFYQYRILYQLYHESDSLITGNDATMTLIHDQQKAIQRSLHEVTEAMRTLNEIHEVLSDAIIEIDDRILAVERRIERIYPDTLTLINKPNETRETKRDE